MCWNHGRGFVRDDLHWVNSIWLDHVSSAGPIFARNATRATYYGYLGKKANASSKILHVDCSLGCWCPGSGYALYYHMLTTCLLLFCAFTLSLNYRWKNAC